MNYKEKNCLLTRDDVGVAKPSTHTLPAKEFAYGAANKKEAYDAGSLTSDW